jgi:hypothetical protein
MRRLASARARFALPIAHWWTLGQSRGVPAAATRRHFGSWNAGLRAAGPPITHRQGLWTGERLIAALQRDARGRPAWSTVASVFGT